MKVTIVLILLCSCFLRASEKPVSFELKDCNWHMDNDLDILLDSKKLKFKDRELILTIWTHGAHGETLRLFDSGLKTNCLIFEKTSGWDIQYEIHEDFIEISFSRETSIDDPTPVRKKTLFRP